MKDGECAEYRVSFPNLDCSYVYETGKLDHSYNCIAWAVGLTNQWVEPGDLNNLAEYLGNRGYVAVAAGAADADIDAPGKSAHYITHVYKRYTDERVPGMPVELWESKMSEGIRMTHNRRGLTNGTGHSNYGDIVGSFKKAPTK